MPHPPLPSPADILAVWRAAGPDKWFVKDAAFDADVRDRFMALYKSARDAKLNAWQNSDDGALALILVLDQFPRNMFRDDPRAFATDAMARDAAARAIDEGRDMRVEHALRAFVYMPFMHSENIGDQERSLSLFAQYGDANNLKFADMHADIIRRFGRFPHRNAVLKRTTTPAEQAFLDSGGFLG